MALFLFPQVRVAFEKFWEKIISYFQRIWGFSKNFVREIIPKSEKNLIAQLALGSQERKKVWAREKWEKVNER